LASQKQVVCFGQPDLTRRPRGVTVRSGWCGEEVSLVAVELQVSVGAADAARTALEEGAGSSTGCWVQRIRRAQP
jgi:hypothetical protein